MMRKLLAFLLIALTATLICGAAAAETYVLDELYSSIEVPDSYIVLKSDNLSTYADWLASRNLNVEDVANDMQKRGVLLQCWTAEYDACFELTAVKSDAIEAIFDVNEQSESVRRSYRLGHYPDNNYEAEGYDFSAADWKNSTSGRFLVLKYIMRDGGEVLYRGLMRRTIRNGYEITLDMRVYGRSVSTKDNTNLNKIWGTYNFIEVQPMPAAASAQVNITSAPPEQTREQSFNIKGTAMEGVRLSAVVMGLSYPTPVLSETVVQKNGKFSLPISLPKEGVFAITLTAEYKGEDIMELLYPVTYQRTLLAVNVTSEIPAVVTEDTLVISGTAEPGATVQLIVNSEDAIKKKVTPAGKFKLEISTPDEGEYTVVLVFSKTGLAEQRLTYSFTRQWTEADMIKALKKQAVKPAYSTLVKKMAGYEGRIMGYNAYLMSATQSGDEWILRMALKKKSDNYSEIILVTSAEEPTFAIGERVMMYGTCAGMSLSTGETGTEDSESYPCFELLLLASLE